MLALSLAEVDEAALLAMCADRRGETSTLEWKEQLPDASDRQKHELAKDVAGLANLDGGDLVFGVAEAAAQAERLAPISGETADAAERRIRQILDSAVEPKIVGIDVRSIPVSGGFVLIVRVPSSFDGPHAVWVNSSRRFVVRNGTLVSDMSYEQIRSAFDRNATLQEQGRQFRAERLALIEAGRTPVPLVGEGPIAVLHVLPISGLARRQTLDVPGLLNGLGLRTYSVARALEPSACRED